jgi:homoserine O-acetyltransferase/O-succinyltransferase
MIRAVPVAAWVALSAAALLLSIDSALAADYPAPVEGDHVVRDFRFSTGEVLPELRLHYTTLGDPVRDGSGTVRNAVLILHGTQGSGAGFLRKEWADTLFGRSQLLDASRYYIILPDAIGSGRSSKPSDGLRARFPRYTYDDMVAAQYRLVTEGLGVDHLRLVIGTSMGGMHAWLWGGRYPGFMDGLLPIVCQPAQISGRNRIQRRLIVDAIRNDPEWNGGNYTRAPQSLATALKMALIGASSARQLQLDAPTTAAADELMDSYVARRMAEVDANDFLYNWDASRTYDPGPGLERIQAQVVAVNFADDEINPPELGVMEREIKRVKRGRYVLIPAGDDTRGHVSFYRTSLWSEYLAELLASTR